MYVYLPNKSFLFVNVSLWADLLLLTEFVLRPLDLSARIQL